PLRRITHEWSCSAEVSTASARPATAAGVATFMVLAFPSSPSSFRPQHAAVPSERTAHEYHSPAATSATDDPSAATATGVLLWALTVPSPSSPNQLRPQHTTLPPWRRAQTCCRPASICVASLSPTTAATGWSLPIVVPSPSCPNPLSPQHCTRP